MNFYHQQQRLVTVGIKYKDYEERDRREFFEIAEDEQLIGCELTKHYEGKDYYFPGVTWMKMKVRLLD